MGPANLERTFFEDDPRIAEEGIAQLGFAELKKSRKDPSGPATHFSPPDCSLVSVREETKI